MKALLYKEFKLAMHPICYLFICVFPLMILIPSYPLGIGFIYVLTCYPILFLGANIDVISEASKLGINKRNAVSYKCEEESLKKVYKGVAMAVESFICAPKVDRSWREEIDEDFEG